MVENILYPAYFDAELTRAKGRRVPEDLAVSDPSVDEVAEAVGQVGYDATIERDAAYPREPWRTRGRVIVKNADDAKRSDLLQAVAAYINALRG
ncbi:signal recognition particle protein Srp19 [Salinarchaeum sp. IM2453]|uniref:signal recognition particle subunit SRP19 n=1 Tax=Salinarchaeum sp. IM2453 TaxID=2862870 RepID=UPI001C82A052|nr:signal recognition particle subunit SRP19 [Salinarchaeum sp. IM2453]QZA88328.1 signal recognition particle protein Srp19 [Salinarchaeum sp. IM2453]